MNIAAVLKREIVRLSRKEVRNETHRLKNAAGQYRSEIAALKRRVQDLEKQLRRQAKAAPARRQEADAVGDVETKVRFSTKGLIAQRKRLGLSAHDIGLLVGASGQSIYNWESGQNRPRASQLPAIAALRTLGKKKALARLAALRAAG